MECSAFPYFLTGNVVSYSSVLRCIQTSHPSRLCDHELPVSGGRTEFVSLCRWRSWEGGKARRARPGGAVVEERLVDLRGEKEVW